jgi:hypothetical protein
MIEDETKNPALAGFFVSGIHGAPCWIITHYRELKMLSLEFLRAEQES